MSIEAGGAFSGKLESIDGLKLNNRAEIHINKYYQGIITLYRVSRKIVNMAQEKIEYLVIKLENEEKITAIGLNFKSASGGVNNCFKLELQADILLKGKMAYANTSKFQEIYFEITEGNELIGLCPYDVNKNYEDIIFCRKIDIPINVENRSVQLENGELIFGVYPKYQYSVELTYKQWLFGKVSPALGVPLQYINAAPVVGFGLVVIRQIQAIWYLAGKLPEKNGGEK